MRRLVLPLAGGGGSDVTVALSSVSVTVSAGTLGVARSNALAGSAATVSVGTLGVSRTSALTGSSVTAIAGTLTADATDGGGEVNYLMFARRTGRR